jgi:hypothetical protein
MQALGVERRRGTALVQCARGSGPGAPSRGAAQGRQGGLPAVAGDGVHGLDCRAPQRLGQDAEMSAWSELSEAEKSALNLSIIAGQDRAMVGITGAWARAKSMWDVSLETAYNLGFDAGRRPASATRYMRPGEMSDRERAAFAVRGRPLSNAERQLRKHARARGAPAYVAAHHIPVHLPPDEPEDLSPRVPEPRRLSYLNGCYQPKLTRSEKLGIMAAQTASPIEAEIARQKLEQHLG